MIPSSQFYHISVLTNFVDCNWLHFMVSQKNYWILFAFILGKYVIIAGHFLQQPISHSIPTCGPHFQGSPIDSSPTLSFMDLTLIGLHWTGSEVFVSGWLKPIPNIFCVDDLDLDLHLRSTLVPPAFLHGFLLHLFSWLPWNGAFHLVAITETTILVPSHFRHLNEL